MAGTGRVAQKCWAEVVGGRESLQRVPSASSHSSVGLAASRTLVADASFISENRR